MYAETERYNKDVLIAVDVRPRSFGFIILNGTAVVDCGGRSCRRAEPVACLTSRFGRLLDAYQPSQILMRSHPPRLSRAAKRNALSRAIQVLGKKVGVPVAGISPQAIAEYFSHHNAKTKYEIALVVASICPELTWKLPPKRKAWESEHYGVSIFDAAAIALTHLNASSGPGPTLA